MRSIFPKKYVAAINNLPQAVRIAAVLIMLGVIFSLWYMISWVPMQKKQLVMQNITKSVREKTSTLQQNIKTLQDTLDQQKQKIQSQKAVVSRVQVSSTGPSPQEISKTLKALLTTHNLNFISLFAIPINNNTDSNTANSKAGTAPKPQFKNNFFEQNISIKFSGDYFATVAYIADIEKLKWPIYWDNLTYTVTKYPNADIALELHSVSLKEDKNHDTTRNSVPVNPANK